MSLITPSTQSELTALYSDATRSYHSMSHVNCLLSLLSTHRPLFADPDAVEAAIWFHDAIYDSRAKPPANELHSAAMAVSALRDTVDPDRLERIKVMIEATATHTVPTAEQLGSNDPGHVQDAAMFLDMDLSILAADEKEYKEYEKGVRKEYQWVGAKEWKKGRGDVLRGFLERDKIYHSEVFRGLWEEKARGNLRDSLEELERKGDGKGCTVG